MFFKKNKQIEEIKQADEPMFMGRGDKDENK